ncbi:MAG: caspase family protein [Nibricoccus sp.]
MSLSETTAVRGDKAFALIVGIGTYQDSRIPTLKYTHADARAFYDLLTDPRRSGFPKENVKLLIDEEATHTQIRKAVNKWLYSQVMPDSTVMIFFAGHGGQEQDKCESIAEKQAYYFLPWDADPEDMASTSLSQNDFEKLVRTLKAQRLVMFLDACHSTGVAKAGGRDLAVVAAPKYERFAEGEGRVVIAAAKPDQRSWEDEKLQHGIFTYHLLEALSGKADGNTDGYVSIQEVVNYLQREVPRTVKLLGKEPQDPTMICESLTRDIILTVDSERVKLRAQELSNAAQKKLEEMQGRRLRLVELRQKNQLASMEFTEAMLINEKTAEECTPTEKVLKEYLDLLLTDKITPQLYLKTRAQIQADKKPEPEPPPLPPPAPKALRVFCIHCGGPNVSDNNFCVQCGKRL